MTCNKRNYQFSPIQTDYWSTFYVAERHIASFPLHYIDLLHSHLINFHQILLKCVSFKTNNLTETRIGEIVKLTFSLLEKNFPPISARG